MPVFKSAKFSKLLFLMVTSVALISIILSSYINYIGMITSTKSNVSRIYNSMQSINPNINESYINILFRQYVEPLLSWIKSINITGTVTYVVFTDGVKYYAKNGSAGIIEYSDADATNVIQYAVNRVGVLGGGTVFIKSGTYVVDTIYVQGVRNVRIVGEGPNTKLVAKGSDTIVFKIGDRSDSSKFSYNVEIAYLYIDGSNQATETDYPENNDRRFGIEIAMPGVTGSGIYIHHNIINNTGSDSVYIYGPTDAVIAYNLIMNTRGYWAAIHEHGATTPSYPLPAHKAIIAFNTVMNTASNVGGTRHGSIIIGNKLVNVGGKDYGPFPSALVGGDDSIIVGNYIESTASGISGILTWRSHNIVVGNQIVNANKHGIVVYINLGNITPLFSHIVEDNYILYPGANGISFSPAGPTDVTVEGNIIIDPAYPYNGYNGNGIVVNGQRNVVRGNRLVVTDTSKIMPVSFINEQSGDYNIIDGNYFPTGVTYRTAPLVKTGANTVVRRNINYLTEASGVATIPAGSTRVTVSHGLATTPTKILITPLGQPPGKIWVENITSTSFDIVTDTAPSTDLKVAWYAEG